MYEINYQKYIEFLKRFLHKLRPRFSFHYISYTTLFFLVIFSVVQLVSATTPNPGHPWSEVGDGTFVVSGPSVSRTYTFPDANATVLTTNNAVTVAQGGTGLNSLGSANQILGINSGGSGMEYKTLTQGSNITITHGTGTVTIAANTGANALGTYITQTATNAPSNAQILGQLSTGILKNTTTTGVLSIATAGDFPTLNQDTTGTAGNISGGLGGQILYQSAANVTSKLNNGDPGQVLTSNGATDAPSWTTIATSPITIVNSSNLFSTGLSSTGAGVDNTTDSIFLGVSAGSGASSADSSNFFGNSAGVHAVSASYSNFFGNSAGDSATYAALSNFFGYSAGSGATNAAYSNFIGNLAGYSATDAVYSNFLGNSSGEGATNASYSNIFGYKAGKSFTGNNIGSNNIIIGTNISLPNNISDSINLGGVFFATGTHSDISGDASIVGVPTGKVGIGVVSPTQILSLDGTAARTIWMERNTTAATAGQGLTLSSGGAIAGTNNLAGGDLNLKSGISTGTGTSSLRFFTATAGSSGSTDNTPSEKMTILGNGNVGLGTTSPNDQLELTKNLRLPVTTSSLIGSIYMGANRFIHAFNKAGDDGNNLFFGKDSGNFTMSSTGGQVYQASYNVGFGVNTLSTLTTGYDNTAIGYKALNLLTTGTFNVAIGENSLAKITNANSNISIGRMANANITTGSNNVSIGGESGISQNTSNNTFVGYYSGHATVYSGGSNLFLGYYAGAYETGSNTLILDSVNRSTEARGRNEALIYGVTNATPTNQILALGGGGKVGIGNINPGYMLHIGSSSVTDSTVLLRLEDSNSTCDFNANNGAPSCGSDITLKKNINDQSDNLSKIIALRPVTYNWLTDPDGVDVKHGFVAQEVAEVMPELVTNGTWVDGSTRKFLQTAGMTPYIVGAIKEMNLKLENINNLDEPNSWRDNIMAWLSNAGNRIARIFTGEVCLTEAGEETVCLNRAELKSLKELINQPAVSTTDITSNEDTNNVTATCSDGIINQDETSVDSGGICDTSSVSTDDGSSSESVIDKNIEKLAPEPEIAPVAEPVSN